MAYFLRNEEERVKTTWTSGIQEPCMGETYVQVIGKIGEYAK